MIDSRLEGETHFFAGFSNTGKDDPLGRDTGGQCASQFAFRDDIRARTPIGQGLQHTQIGVRLHRIANHRVQFGEGAGKNVIVPCQCRC